MRKRGRSNSEIGAEIDYGTIHHMEAEAYHAVLKAFSAQSDTLSWDRVALMTKLRKELNVTDDEHGEFLVRIRKNDDSIRMLREWRNSNGVSPLPGVKKRSDFIQIAATDMIVREVEKLLDCREELSPARLEKAKLVLQEHEMDILEALDQLADDDD